MRDRTQVLDDHGEPVIGHRIKLLGASGIKTETFVDSGEWVEITVRGVAGERTYDPQKQGTVREVTVQASTQGAIVKVIEAPPEIEGQAKLEMVPPEVEGQTKMIDTEPDEGTEPE